MSMVNHFPRACTGPGNRPGICAPSGKHVNSIRLLLGFAHPTRLPSGMRDRESGAPVAEAA